MSLESLTSPANNSNKSNFYSLERRILKTVSLSSDFKSGSAPYFNSNLAILKCLSTSS